MLQILEKIKNSQKFLLNLSPLQKQNLILKICQNLSDSCDEILKENEKDVLNAQNCGLSLALIDRLKLDKKRVENIIKSLEVIANLKDPVGKVIEGWQNYCGLKIEKVSVPIGVILSIYESRPNVTAEVAALCLKSSNCVILKGGKEAIFSNLAIANYIKKALKFYNLSEFCVYFWDLNRDELKEILQKDDFIDLVIPRGGSSLINFIKQNSKIPSIMHDKGICSIFVDESANYDEALKICINAKISKPSACNSIETILIHENAKDFLEILIANFKKLGVEIFACENIRKIYPNFAKADFGVEFLDFKINLKIVKNLSEAINHINKFGSNHSDAIISKNYQNIENFLNLVDSACVYANTTTRFSDGGEFGFGAEVGISTNKLHARGPMGVNDLVTYKYKIRGEGQIRN